MVETKSTENVYWSASRYFLISDQKGLTPRGWVNKLQATAWDPINKRFQMIDLPPGGQSYEMTMTIEGKITNIVGSRTHEGHVTKIWVTSEEISPKHSHFRSECSVDDGPKWLFAEGDSKKVAPARSGE